MVDDQPVPSPSQAKVHQHKPRNDTRRQSPDRRAQGDIVNASSRPDDSPVEAEKELPEEGFTRGLVAQWRVKEQTTGKQVQRNTKYLLTLLVYYSYNREFVVSETCYYYIQ